MKYMNKNYDKGLDDFLFNKNNKIFLDLKNGINSDLLDAANKSIKKE